MFLLVINMVFFYLFIFIIVIIKAGKHCVLVINKFNHACWILNFSSIHTLEENS